MEPIDSGRTYHLKNDSDLDYDLHMTDDGLGWLQIEAITEPSSLRQLIALIDMGSFERRETNGLLMPCLVARKAGSES